MAFFGIEVSINGTMNLILSITVCNAVKENILSFRNYMDDS